MKKAYTKTPKLKEATFRGQKELLVQVLSKCNDPVTIEELATLVDAHGRYSALLNNWAKENGGVKGSILYHLRELERRGMVEASRRSESMRTHVVSWGNSEAIRIPRAMLDQLHMREGDEVELLIENGRLAVQPVQSKLTLQALVDAITPENRHGELDWGKPVGNEVW